MAAVLPHGRVMGHAFHADHLVLLGDLLAAGKNRGRQGKRSPTKQKHLQFPHSNPPQPSSVPLGPVIEEYSLVAFVGYWKDQKDVKRKNERRVWG
jgi:hypothetical protein